jgi:hypothetical protein
MPDFGFAHVYKPAPAGSSPSSTLLLLHGTGGDEHDMLPLGGLMPGANLLSPRGQVLENGQARFFRRLSEGVFDVEDVRHRAGDLAAFVDAAGGPTASTRRGSTRWGFRTAPTSRPRWPYSTPGCCAGRSCCARWSRSSPIPCRRCRVSAP